MPETNTSAMPKKKKGGLWKKILIGLAALIVVLVIFIAMQPNEFSISRSATMNAPAATVFAQVNDLHKWQAWSPWAKLDPTAKSTFVGESGEGSSFKWDGNNQVGAGTMTITKSHPNDLVHINLEFIRPFAGTNQTEFTFKPEGAGTTVTWTMSGQNNFMAKAMHLCFNMDKMLGGDFEKGLASLKGVVEKKNG